MNADNLGTPRRIITQAYDFSVQDLVSKVESGEVILDPDYQRNYTWAVNDIDNKRSRLIESLLLNIPIPVIYFAEMQTLKYEVIDGQQRLRTLVDFLGDKFELNNLELRHDLNNKKYSQLSQNDKDIIRKRSIRAIVILNDSDEKVKYEVFERLNLGSVQLTKQEIRNATLRGPFNDLLKKLASNELFKKRLSFNLKSDINNMAYEEMVLRFFAYHERDLKRVDILATFLTDFMREKRNIGDEELEKKKDLFLKTLNKIDDYLGDDAFCVLINSGDKKNNKANRSLYDAEMLAFARAIDRNIDIVDKCEFKKGLSSLMKDKDFKDSLKDQAGGKKIRKRVESIQKILYKNQND